MMSLFSGELWHPTAGNPWPAHRFKHTFWCICKGVYAYDTEMQIHGHQTTSGQKNWLSCPNLACDWMMCHNIFFFFFAKETTIVQMMGLVGAC